MNSYRLRELKLEINRNCPLHCIHRSSNGEPDAPEVLSLTDVNKLIAEFIELGGEKLSISGGEPLCHPDIPNILNLFTNTNLQISIYSTGISRVNNVIHPISDDLVSLIAKNNIRFIFSIHGANSDTHETITQVKGSFDTTIESVKKLINAETTVEAHIVPNAINIDEMPDIINVLSLLGVHNASWLRFVPQGRGSVNKHILSLSKKQLSSLSDLKKDLALLHPNVKIRTGAPFNILCPETPAECSAGISVLTVRPDGYATPCDAFKQFMFKDPLSNILNFPLSEVWNHSHILNTIRRIHMLSSTSTCSSCSQYNRCRSGCIAQKAVAAGMLIDGRDPECLLKGVEVSVEQFEKVSV